MADSGEDGQFGRKFKAMRELKGVSQAVAAKRGGVRQPFLSKVEAGEVIPSLKRCRELAQALGCRFVIVLEPF